MKNRILKIVTVILLLATLIVTNFIYVGVSIVSYAASNITTNHQNVEFDAQIKEGNILSLFVNVRKEGYFNGEITLENSNFSFVTDQSNSYINKLEKNKIKLNQLNAGTTAQIDLKIEPVNEEIFKIDLLNTVSKLNITGIYRDSTQKDINIKTSREVKYQYFENSKDENIENTAEVITNKVMKVAGEDKRVIQLKMNLGLKENNYPIKEINSTITIPTPEDSKPTIIGKVNYNTMKNFTYNYDGKNTVELKFVNEPNEENKILWKKQGNEKVIITLIYDKNVVFDNTEILHKEKITLYNEKELTLSNKLVLDNQEKEEIISINTNSTENSIYKGKLYAGIDRQYESKTNIAVNLANAEQYIDIKEEETKYLANEQETSANVIFNKTTINKDTFNKIFGENGQIVISNENGEILSIIDANTQADENNNIIVDYTGKEPKVLQIKTTTPIAEGDLEITQTKTIKAQDKQIVQTATVLTTKTSYEYGVDMPKETSENIQLEDTKTEATLLVDKETLSTVVENTVEMKATLRGNYEQYNLYKNPSITFELPEDVESIIINNINLIYENELKIKNYEVNNKTVTVYLEGEQTQYKDISIEGAVIVVNANIVVNKKAATKDSNIIMTVHNENNSITDSKNIKIVAPKDVTAINNIKELNVETIGQEEIKEVTLERGKEAKQLEANIEVINNNENAIGNVKIVGTFPTKNTKNNIDTEIIEGIHLDGIEGAKVYYTEKEEATEDIQNESNGWTEGITNATNVKKYLIEVPAMDSQSSIKGTYKMKVPELLEYNQLAEEGYTTKYTNLLTNVESKMDATTIKLGTGVGPILESKLTPIVGTSQVSNNGTVKNGEVIKYKVEVSNTGSEEITNVAVRGEVPEGTTLVVPQDNYEYTGSSYYKELPDKVYEANIDKIGVGDVISKEYEVRVNTGVESGTKILNATQIKYGDVIKQSNESQLVTENGDLRVSVKRVTDRTVDLYETSVVKYFAIIENVSNRNQDNITVKTKFSDPLEVTRLTLITGMESKEVSDDEIYRSGNGDTQTEIRDIGESELTNTNSDENIQSEELEYKEDVNIGSLAAGEVKVLSYDMIINKTGNSGNISFCTTAKEGNDEYRSNIITDNVIKADISLNMTTNTQSQYVKAGDTIGYVITVKNNGTQRIEGLKIKDVIPSSLTVNKVYFDEEEIEQLREVNDIEISCSIAAQSEATIAIETVVNYSAGRTQAEPITNVAYAEMLTERIATTSEINHVIEANKEETDDNQEDTMDDTDIADGSQMITGIAWFDVNANGKKDDNEELLSNVKVHLLNTKTNNLVKNSNGSVLEASTNENGLYVLDHIRSGKYIVIFEYENTRFALTRYKAENVEEAKNSDAMTNELTIEGQKQQVASTDILEISQENISNINIGLIELKDFSFRLDKYINRILIQDSTGTTIKEYTDATVAKAELDAKKVNGANVIIEYKLRVTNIGEIDGYVKKIVDYIPNDLKFSSELNKDWYQTAEGLYNISLANEKIVAGESKEVMLTLTKAMTEDNTGLINNTAEIAESYNELGIADSKSTPGNKAQGESDYGSADAILSLKTGGEVYIVITIAVVVILGVIAFVVIRKKILKGEN